MDLIIGAGVTGISNANFTKEQLCHAGSNRQSEWILH